MSLTPLNEDLDIIQNLVIPSIEDDLDIIQKLDDEPNDVGGLTAAELKAKFDEAGNTIKSYINNTLVPQLSGTVAEEEERAAAEEERKAAEADRKQTFSTVLATAEECRDISVASAKTAVTSAETSVEMASDSEAWAVGTRDGQPVSLDDPSYNNNAKYYKEQAQAIAGSNFDPAGSAESVKQELTPMIQTADKQARLATMTAGSQVGQLEDFEIAVGKFANAGAGWNSFFFPVPFDGIPNVILQPEGFDGWAEVKDITETGFLYCLRTPEATTEVDIVVHWIAVEYNGGDPA